MKQIQTAPHFVKPYPQAALGGELGLTLTDIAQSLGAEVFNVRKKFLARGMSERLERLSLTAIPIGMANKSNGLEVTEYVLPVEAAKFFIARWDSELGDGYLRMLIEYERIVLEEMPKLIRALQEQKAVIIKLKANAMQLPRRKPGPKKGNVPVFMLEDSLFQRFDDEVHIPTKVKKVFVPRSELTQKEILANENISMNYCIDGMMRKIIKNQALIMYYEQPAHVRLKPAK